MTNPQITAPVIDNDQLILLVREVVVGVHELPTILERFKLTPERYAELKETEDFKRFFDAIETEWKGASNTQQRLQMNAAALLEVGLPSIAAGMMKTDEPLNHRVEAAKFLKSVTGIGEKANGALGDKFTITINLGADKLQYEKNLAPTPPLAAPPITIQVEQPTQASGSPTTLLPKPEGS